MLSKLTYIAGLLAFLCSFLATSFAAELKKLAPLDVFELEYASDPQISPDAKHIVYERKSMDIMRDYRQTRLWIVDADGKNHRKLTSTDKNEHTARWSPDGTRIAYVTQGRDGQEVTLFWVDTGQQARLSQLPASPQSLTWSPDGKSIAFSMFVKAKAEKLVTAPKAPKGAKWADPPRVITQVKHEDDGVGRRNPGYYQLFVLPAEGGTARQITSGKFRHRGPLSWSPDGQSLLFSANRNSDWEYDYHNSEVYRVSIADGLIQVLTSRSGPDSNPIFSPDGKQIAYTSFEYRERSYHVTGLYVMDADGSNQRLLTAGLDRDVKSIRWDPTGQGLFFLFDDYGRTKLGHVFLKGKITELCDNAGGAFLGQPVSASFYSIANNGTIAYTQSTIDRPADVALLQANQKPRQLTQLNDDLLNHRQLGEVEEFWYESSHDQRKIQGWIIKPPGFDPKKKYPLILEIHGGPISNYGHYFSVNKQLHAAAGYVVLYVNPRGSTGYGQEFGDLLYHDFPGHDYDDLMSGVDSVIQRGFIDTEQLYVTGGSSGGTMTAWVVGKTDRFRAAVVSKPVINWVSKTLVADNYFAYYNNRYPGLPWENPDGYLRDSPLMLASNMKTPTLILVGTSDLRTPPSEAKQLYHALKIRKVDTALVEIPGASHFIDKRPSQLITKSAHELAWFEKYSPKAKSEKAE